MIMKCTKRQICNNCIVPENTAKKTIFCERTLRALLLVELLFTFCFGYDIIRPDIWLEGNDNHLTVLCRNYGNYMLLSSTNDECCIRINVCLYFFALLPVLSGVKS